MNEKVMRAGCISREAIIKHITVDPNKTLVDIGCSQTILFRNRPKTTNVDIRSLEELRREDKNPDLEIPNFIQADAHDLPFEDQQFDYAILGEILEHVDDPLQVLNEAQRIAKIVVITVPNEYEWIPSLNPCKTSSHKRFFTEPSLKKLLTDSGLYVYEFIKINYAGWAYFIGVGMSKNQLKR